MLGLSDPENLEAEYKDLRVGTISYYLLYPELGPDLRSTMNHQGSGD